MVSIGLVSSSPAEYILRRGENEVKGTRHGDMFVPCAGEPFKILSSDVVKETVEKCESKRQVITGALKLVKVDVANGTMTVATQGGQKSFPLPDDKSIVAKIKKLNVGESIPVKLVDKVPFKVDEEALK